MPTDVSTTMEWFTTFYYEEELRSMLFNGVFNSGFKPGIYNPKMAIYTVAQQGENPDKSPIYPGVHLYIGKGTTFVFSNKYSYDGNRYHLDLKTPGNYIIKSTAANDLDIMLIRLGQNVTNGADKVMGDFAKGVAALKKFYIMASLLYDEDENNGASHPTIELAIDNPLFNTTLDRDNDEINFYYNLIGQDIAPTTTVRLMPDGSRSYEVPATSYGENLIAPETLLQNNCYLPIGVVLDVGNITHYLNGSEWNSVQLGVEASQEWTKNHVFIGRGLPSYRQNYIANKWDFSPDLVPNTELNALYLDVNDIYDGDILYNSELSTDDDQGWEGPFGIGLKGASLDKEPDRTAAYRMDMKCENPQDLAGSSGDPDNYESTDYTDPSNIIDDINNNYIKDDTNHPFLTSNYLLISDIIFLTTRRRYSNTPDNSIVDMFTKKSVLNNKLKVVPFRWYSTLESVERDPTNAMFNPSTKNDEISENSINFGDTLTLNGYSLSQTRLLPLDICENNQTRLYKIIKNKNIIPTVIDYMRQHVGESPYLNPIEATSLVPAAVIFRKVKIEKTEDGTKIKNLIPVDTVSKITSVQKQVVQIPDPEHEGEFIEQEVSTTLQGRFHPANVLSFFDMEFKTNRLNPINFNSADIYSVLPVIS